MAVETELRPAGPDDREYAERLLAGEGLPVAALSETLDFLYCWVAEGETVGVGGLEVHGDHAPLRSVVEELACGAGHGRALCERLLAEAGDAGVDTVYLLTTTAPAFFASLGFAETDWKPVPAAIRDTGEFADLCPDAAVCMAREVPR